MSMQAIGNWFLFVGQQWLNSLKVFLPKNFKLFILVTLNAWWQATKTYFLHFWWLLFVIWALNTYEFHLIISQILQFFLSENNALLLFFKQFGTKLGFAKFAYSIHNYSINFFGIRFALIKCLDFLPYFLIFLAIRPSVGKKTYRYFFSYLGQYILFVLCLFVIDFLSIKLYFRFFHPSMRELASLFSFLFEDIIDFLIISPIFIFAIFFFLDSKGWLTDLIFSFWRGLKMAFYSYPFAIISVYLFRYVVLWSFGAFAFFEYIFNMAYVGVPISLVISWLLYLFYFSWLNTCYIKRAHEDYELYFK